MMSLPSVTNVALVGCGAVSQTYYAPALQELTRHALLQVRALYDPDPQNLAQLMQRFPTARCVATLDELPAQQINLAIIASPPRFHAEQTVQLLKSGVSVLCEKPMAVSVAEAEAMVAAAATAPGVLAIGLFRRFFPACQMIRRILSLELLGDVTSFTFCEGGPFRWPVQSAAYFRRNTANGGVLMDIGVHVLDLLIWWLGSPDEIVYEDDAMGGIEVNSRIRCRFARGTTGEIRLSRDCVLANRYVIHGTKGWVSWDVNEADRLQIGLSETDFALNGQIQEVTTTSRLPTLGQRSHNFQQSFISQLHNVVSAMQGAAVLVVPGEQGVQSLRLIEQCYRQRTLLPMGWLDESEQVMARKLNDVSRE